jgi:hypothetical protein
LNEVAGINGCFAVRVFLAFLEWRRANPGLGIPVPFFES